MLGAVGLLVLLVVPFGVCALRPRAFRYVSVVGIAYAAAEWALAYRSSLVEHGGDWTGGTELLTFTGFFALLFFAIWVGSAFAGLALGRKFGQRA